MQCIHMYIYRERERKRELMHTWSQTGKTMYWCRSVSNMHIYMQIYLIHSFTLNHHTLSLSHIYIAYTHICTYTLQFFPGASIDTSRWIHGGSEGFEHKIRSIFCWLRRFVFLIKPNERLDFPQSIIRDVWRIFLTSQSCLRHWVTFFLSFCLSCITHWKHLAGFGGEKKTATAHRLLFWVRCGQHLGDRT